MHVGSGSSYAHNSSKRIPLTLIALLSTSSNNFVEIEKELRIVSFVHRHDSRSTRKATPDISPVPHVDWPGFYSDGANYLIE